MSRQNRVNPFSEIIATPARGTLMGNRGRLHDEHGRIRRPYQGKRWIICRLQFKNRRRTIMAPNRYTELFFLDEATALAAGHRPCAECSRSRFNEFIAIWAAANPELAGGLKVTAALLDAVLHRERLAQRRQATYPASLAELPDGAFITFDGQQAYLVWAEQLWAWQPDGYGPRLARPRSQTVEVLTPRSVVRALAYGYRPAIHTLSNSDSHCGGKT